MDKNPKRRRIKDNPYSLSRDESKSIYIVSFKDVSGNMHKVEVTEEVYRAFNEFELKDLSQLNEYDNHIEHSVIYENNLEKRSKYKAASIEDDFIKKSTFEELKSAIEMLPEVQRRRIKKYYFEDMSETEIAIEENVSQKNISKTLKTARKNLKEFLKNFN